MSDMAKFMAVVGLLLAIGGPVYGLDSSADPAANVAPTSLWEAPGDVPSMARAEQGFAPDWPLDQGAGRLEDSVGQHSPGVAGIDAVRNDVLGQSHLTPQLGPEPSEEPLPEYRLEKNLLPEPLSVAVWSLIGLTWAGLSIWRRRAAVQEGAGGPRMGGDRRPWPEESRIAIRAMIERGRHSRGGL